MIRLFLVVTLLILAYLKVDASELYVDITHVNGKQVILIEKNGVTSIIPVTDDELDADKLDDNISKKVCSVLKCRNLR